MAYLICIGMNNGRQVCKGYYVRRRGKEVTKRWGGVDAKGPGLKAIVWTGPNKYYRFSFPSEAKAKADAAETIAKRLKRGYELLPPGKRILSRPAAT
jgi:predicted DNA-binding WGR domain protein